MGENLINSMVAVAVSLVGLATIAVLVSRNAATSQVIGAASKGLAQDIAAAVSPVTGGLTGGGSPLGDFSLSY